MSFGRLIVVLIVCGAVIAFAWTVKAEPSFDQTARYILDIVKAFRTAYVLQVVEHARDGGVTPREDWQQDSHFIPLPAQFVKGAADQVQSLEIGLIGLTPLNAANLPKTQAESDALKKLVSNREVRVVSFVDGDQFKAVSADLALVQSCVDCHNHHPRSIRRDFQRWDVMGGIVVRLKLDDLPEGMPIKPEPPRRPAGPLDRLTPRQ